MGERDEDRNEASAPDGAQAEEPAAKVGPAWFSWFLGLAVLATLVGFVRQHAEHEALAHELVRAAPRWLFVALVCQLATYVADAAIFQGVLERAGVATKLVLFVPLGLAKLFLDQALPSGGISGTLLIVRALDRRGVPHDVTAAAILVDLLAHYVAHCVLTLAAIGVFLAIGKLTPAVLLPSAAFALLAIAVPSLLLFVYHRGEAAVPRILGVPLRPLLRAVSGARASLVDSRALLVRSTALHAAILVFDALTLVAMLEAIDLHPPLFATIACYVIATIVKLLGIVPGGLGTFDIACVALLHLVGVPMGAALAATLLYRGASFWIPLVPGLVFAQREGRARPVDVG